jgi:O-antigen ligase
MTRLLIAIFALAPLAFAPGWLFYFDVTPKIALIAAGAAAALFAVRPGRVPLALIAALALSTVFSTHIDLSIGGSNWRRFGLVLHASAILFSWALARSAASGDARRDLLRAIAISGCGVALYGIAQYFGVDPWLPKSAYHVGEGERAIVRPPSTLGHASYSATWLLLVLFAAVDLRGREAVRAWRTFAALVAALSGIAIVLGGTRAALVAMAAGAAMLLMFGWRPRLRRVAVAAAVAAAFVISPAGRALRSRALWASEDVLGGARLLLWRDAARMAMERPLAGFGPETFATEFPRRQSAELAKAYPDFYYESPHNVFLDALVSQGAPGLLLLAVLFGLALARSRRDPAMAAALAALVVAQQFTAFTAATALATYLAAFLLLPGATGLERRPRPWSAAPPSLAILTYAATLLAADRTLARVRGDLDAGRLEEAMNRYATLLRPPGGSPDLWYSRRLFEAARRSGQILPGAQGIMQATQIARRATETAEDRFNAWYSLAAFEAVHGDAEAVERALRESIAWAPRWFKSHWALAQALDLAGRFEEAEREAALAAELNSGRNPEVAATLERIRTRPRN